MGTVQSIKVLIATSSFGSYDAEIEQLLRDKGLEIVSNPHGRTLTEKELRSLAAGCAGIIAGTERYNAETLEALKDLKVISRCGAGVDAIDLEAASRRGIQVLTTPYGPTQAVAELTIGLILNLIRHISNSDHRLRSGRWEKPMGFLLSELKVGILGLGKIGKAVAAILRRFDAAVIACDTNADRDWAMTHNVALRDRDYLLKECDIVCVHLPHEKALHHSIGAKEIARMKPGSFLINTSRGGIIEETALVEALKSNHLRGAALDVFEEEPYKGPLCQLDNAILTPHIGSYARAGRVAMERESVENLLRVLKEVIV